MPSKYTHACEICTRPYTSTRREGRFCSRECQGAWRRAQMDRRPCASCGVEMVIHAHHRHRQFCSPACANKAQTYQDIDTLLRENRRIVPGTGCWDWSGRLSKDGYGRVTIAGKEWRVHRLAWTHFRGPIPDGLDVCHNCPGGDNPACFNPDHCFLGTNGDNNTDRHRKGRDARGERSGRTTLTSDQVREIRALSAAKVRRADIAARFGISVAGVKTIVSRRSWAHLDDPPPLDLANLAA